MKKYNNMFHTGLSHRQTDAPGMAMLFCTKTNQFIHDIKYKSFT
jgi:hypothetical protein